MGYGAGLDPLGADLRTMTGLAAGDVIWSTQCDKPPTIRDRAKASATARGRRRGESRYAIGRSDRAPRGRSSGMLSLGVSCATASVGRERVRWAVEVIDLSRICLGLEIDGVAGPIGPLDLEARCAGVPRHRNRGPQTLLEGRGLGARHRSILIESATALVDRGLGGGLYQWL
jgi:hypothetical protein